MHRLAITRIEKNHKNYIAYILLDENRKICDLQVFEPEEETLLNNIYVGYVEKVVPNIQAAFVRIANGQKGYLPLKDLRAPVFTHKQSEKKQISEGDELLVQVTRDAVKTKDAVVSTKLVLHGHYCFLSSENTTLGTSKKISKERAQELIALANVYCKEHDAEGYGLVFRTNAQNVSEEELKQDIRYVQQCFATIKTTGRHGTTGNLIYRNIPGYLEKLKTQDLAEIDHIYTDQQDLYEEIGQYLPNLKEQGILVKYDDSAVSLAALYHIRGNLEELLGQKVWLASGANIIIETLETLTVVDVNSGKNQSKKEETLFAVNMEAAREILRQIRLRNISGMIIIDFINLKSKEQQEALIQFVKQELKKDHVPASFIDITKLGLMELTRKKVYKSLREILK